MHMFLSENSIAACINERRLKRNHYVCDKGIAPHKMSIHKKLKLCVTFMYVNTDRYLLSVTEASMC